ncbi:MAG: phenylalanine--tRNA ligase subunit beta [Bacilli bacterium]|nr:phenylalanine--tRNA ligase subunit beta [Bacilli bacterium]
MRVKLEWLNELVDLTGIAVNELVDKLSLYSTEVEGIDKVIEGTNLVIGHVLSKEKHPDSDHLSICQVDVKKEVLQIVCGAPNVASGQYVIVAVSGAVLPGDFKIKKSKIRGVESNGMICSLQELGMEKKYVPEKYQSGIYYFEKEVEAGDDPLKALNFSDEIIDLSITPNRGDLMSMLGVAYEVSAIFNRPLKELAYRVLEDKESTMDNVAVSIASKKCSLYYAKAYKDIEIKESPEWLTSRLIAFGVRPINNVVDITNYIQALYGQPLHAFDSDKLGKIIKVRNAEENEKIVTLDEIERELKDSDLVITDGVKPVAIAGVMGGLDTEITTETKNMILEAAIFDPASIRATSSRLGLRSEASIRFERGVDTNRTKLALDYASYLLQTLANARVLKKEAVAGVEKIEDTVIPIHEDYVSKVLGIRVEREEIERIVKALRFEVLSEDDIIVKVPNRRSDIKIKADLVEEIGRIHGYDKLPLTLPESALRGAYTDYQTNRRTLRHALLGLGLDEIITYSLLSEDKNQAFDYNHYDNSEQISLLNSISKERKCLRMGLIPSILEVVEYDFARKMKDIAVFEIGKVYYNLVTNKEEEVLAISMANKFSDTLWSGKSENVDFYLIKGIVDAAFKSLGVELDYLPLEKDIKEMHPKRTAIILYNGKEIGFIGELHPKYAQDRDLEGVYVAEIKIESLLNIKHDTPIYKAITKVPSVERDIAIVVKNDVLASSIVSTIKKTDKKGLSDVKIFDIYSGDKIGKDEKSIAIKMTFTSFETLTDDIINNKVNKILKELTKEHNAQLRA